MVKAVGMLNLFGNAGFTLTREQLCAYARNAMDLKQPESTVKALERYKIIRYAEYKRRVVLFEGTDINIEDEILKAGWS